jgi:hypothetical protein
MVPVQLYSLRWVFCYGRQAEITCEGSNWRKTIPLFVVSESLQLCLEAFYAHKNAYWWLAPQVFSVYQFKRSEVAYEKPHWRETPQLFIVWQVLGPSSGLSNHSKCTLQRNHTVVLTVRNPFPFQPILIDILYVMLERSPIIVLYVVSSLAVNEILEIPHKFIQL